MCLYLKDINKRVAEEDIKVWKILSSATRVNANSYYSDYEYIRNHIQHSLLELTYCPNPNDYNYLIYYAFHSYGFDIKVSSHNNYYKVGGNNINYNGYFKWKPQYIGLFIIPKGTNYYLYDDTYASDQIEYTGKFREIHSINDYRKFIKQYGK